jgi:glycerate 2-kinase
MTPGAALGIDRSGPAVPDPTTFAEARAILTKYSMTSLTAVIEHLERVVVHDADPGPPRADAAQHV